MSSKDLIIVSASGQENVRQENCKSSIFLSYIFLSAGLHGRNDDQSALFHKIRRIISRIFTELISSDQRPNQSNSNSARTESTVTPNFVDCRRRYTTRP